MIHIYLQRFQARNNFNDISDLWSISLHNDMFYLIHVILPKMVFEFLWLKSGETAFWYNITFVNLESSPIVKAE
jgi:hypothetical protein